MAEYLERPPEWAYKPTAKDSPEVQDVASNADVLSWSPNQVFHGKFQNGEPCDFRMDEAEKTSFIHNREITQLRSCALINVVCDDERPRYGIQLSTKIGTEFVWFEIFFDDVLTTMKVLNVCRKFFHEMGGYIDYLCAKWIGKLMIQVSDVRKSTPTNSDSDEEFTVLVDEEGIFLFRNFRKRIPDFFLFFYKESTDNSIERALVQHYTDSIILESLTTKITIQHATENSSFTGAMRSVQPKPKAIFEDRANMVKYLRELNEVYQHTETPKTHPKDFSDPSERRFYEGANSTERRPRFNYEETPSYQRRDDINNAADQATIFSRELDEAFQTLSLNEDFSIPWIVAEDEIKAMIENPEPWADIDKDMLSGGLDPNNPDHLLICFSEIKEHLSFQRYDMALARLKGTKAVFKDSKVAAILTLIRKNDLELLKKLYFHTFFQG